MVRQMTNTRDRLYREYALGMKPTSAKVVSAQSAVDAPMFREIRRFLERGSTFTPVALSLAVHELLEEALLLHADGRVGWCWSRETTELSNGACSLPATRELISVELVVPQDRRTGPIP